MPLNARASQDTVDPYDAYRDWFTHTDTLVAIDLAAQETKAWLFENEQKIIANGMLVVEPWFDELGFSGPLPNEMAEAERHYTLEIQAHEHGIGYFLRRLDKHEVFDCEHLNALTFLRSGELYAWMRFLVRMSWKNQSINLGQFRDTGDYGPNTPAAHSKRKLLRAAELGIALVDRSGGPFSYAISAGPIAKTFYETVWYPVVKDFRCTIRRWK